MGFFANRKGLQAIKLHNKGELDKAMALYKEAIEGGANSARIYLSYSVLLIRRGEFPAARELLVKAQNMPDLSPAQKSQLFQNYACCVYKMGEIDKGIALLERQHAKQPEGSLYQTLGYLYVEKYDMKNKPVIPMPESGKPAEYDEDGNETAPAVSAEELQQTTQAQADADWEAGVQKAIAFNEEAVDYDDEDPICLDNMGQVCYRIKGNKEEALTWFKKAIDIKPSQIDTLWFLSRYDVENGDKAAALEKLSTALEGRFSPLNFITKDEVTAEIARLKA